MRFKNQLFCMFVCLTLALHGADGGQSLSQGITTQVMFPSMTNITAQQEAIAHQLRQTEWAKIGIYAGLSAGALAALYILYNDYKLVSASSLEQYSVRYADFMLQCMQNLKEQFPDKALTIPTAPVETSGLWSSIYGFGIFMCKSVAAIQLQRMVEHRVFHDQSAEWFVRQQTSLIAVYKEVNTIKIDMELLKNRSIYITRYQADRYANALIRLHNALLVELEMVLGYINYKVEAMKIQTNHLLGERMMGSYLYQRSYDVAQAIHTFATLYATHTNDTERTETVVAMFEAINAHITELNSSLSSLKRLEEQMQAV